MPGSPHRRLYTRIMGLINLTLPSDGETIDAADVNTPFGTIATAINGNLDNANIKSGAAIDGTKIADNSIPNTKMINAPLGWTAFANNPNTITYNGNRNYDLVFNSTDLTSSLSPGMRLKLSRTVAAPDQCADLEASSSQYFSKTSPSAMTFTDDFTVSAWVKLESYPATNMDIVSRYNGTSGWRLTTNSNGQVVLVGYNAGGSNYSQVQSHGSLPLNKWVHIAAQLDMSTFTATSTTSYIMLDGLDTSVSVTRGGTNPTALIQAGNLEVGGVNGGTSPFDGKIAQVAIYNAKVTQANIRATMSQGLTGSETSLISAYSLDNSLNDLNTTNANNLTANGGALATNADSPFANAVSAGTEEYAIINSVSFSTNTTVNVQVPAGCAIPTSGGISNTYYSTHKSPYGLPSDRKMWELRWFAIDTNNTWVKSAPAANTWYNVPIASATTTSTSFTIPPGSWRISSKLLPYWAKAAGSGSSQAVWSTSSSSNTDPELSIYGDAPTVTSNASTGSFEKYISQSSATTWYLIIRTVTSGVDNIYALTRDGMYLTVDYGYL